MRRPQADGRKVAVAGDGIDDAPARAAAEGSTVIVGVNE